MLPVEIGPAGIEAFDRGSSRDPLVSLPLEVLNALSFTLRGWSGLNAGGVVRSAHRGRARSRVAHCDRLGGAGGPAPRVEPPKLRASFCAPCFMWWHGF
jgi:hypothetical protein